MSREGIVKSSKVFQNLPLPARCAVAIFGVAGVITILWTALSEPFNGVLQLLAIVGLAVATAQMKVRLYKDSTISFLTSVVLLSLLIGGTREALLAGICGVTVQTYFPHRKLELHRLVFNVGMIAVTIQSSAWVYAFFLSRSSGSFPSTLASILGASSMYYLGNSLSVSLIIALSKRESMLRLWLDHFIYAAPSFIIAGLLSLLAFELAQSREGFMLLTLVPVASITYYASVRNAGARARAL